jgi:hypothetical protein
VAAVAATRLQATIAAASSSGYVDPPATAIVFRSLLSRLFLRPSGCRRESRSLLVSQFLFVWLITSLLFLVSYNHLDLFVAFLIDFVCRLDYLFFLSRTLFCHMVFFVALVTSLFIVSRCLVKDILLMLPSMPSFYYLSFAVVHRIIPSQRYMPFAVVTYIISST